MTLATPLLILVAAALIRTAAAADTAPRLGVVVMHGKGGAPTKHVEALAASLEAKGYLVANLDMPWSERRSYDASVAAAESEVESALSRLRAQGAASVFVAGHSLGGLFALYFGGRHPVDGIIAIAPGGNAASPAYRERLGGSVSEARKLIAAGKGDARTRFLDFEGSKGVYGIFCTPANYLNWFDPDGATNEFMAVKNLSPKVPVLFIVPTGDYPPLQNAKQAMFAALPPHPLTRLYEPESTHLDAPANSVEEIERWTAQVAASRSTPETQAITPHQGRSTPSLRGTRTLLVRAPQAPRASSNHAISAAAF